MYKKSLVFLLIALLTITLCSCTEKAPDTQEIISAIPTNFITIKVADGSEQMLEIDEVDIYKRKTEDGHDYVYATVTWLHSDYSVITDCYMEFSYYDVGGWLLDYITITDEAEVELINYLPKDTAQAFINQFYNEPILVAEQFYPEKETIAYTFYIDERYENCSYSGELDVTYTLSHKMFYEDNAYVVDINWDRYFEDASHLTYNWAVEGSWYMEILDYFGVYQTYINLDSFDGTFVDVDAKSYYTAHGNPQDTEPHTFTGQVNLSYDYSIHSMPEMMLDFIIRKDGSAYYRVSFKKNDARVDKDKNEYNQLVRVLSENAGVQPQNTSAFNFATATDEELIQKFASLITQIFDSDENVNDVRILTSDNDVIYRPDYDDSRCWNTINSIQINGQWLSEEGVYLSASGFDDRIIIYLCTNGGSTDIGWIYDWDGNIIKDYNGQSLSDYIMTSVYGYAASAPALSTDGLEQTTQNFVDFVSEGNGAAITEMLPPRLSELAVLNNMSEDDLVQMLLSMHLENCPILEKTISSVCVEMLSIKSASVLGDTDLFDFYSVNQCGVTLTSILNEEGTEYWLAAIWLPLDSAWYLIDTSWYSSLDAIPIALF